MDCRALALQSRSEHVDGIHGARAQSAANCANARRHDVSGCGIILVAVSDKCVAMRDESLKILERGKVDGAVGEHANEAHGKATVEGADACRTPHFSSGVENEGVPMEATFHGLALHAAIWGLAAAE